MSLSVLQKNLIEMSNANNLKLDLVASVDQSRVYHKDFGCAFLYFRGDLNQTLDQIRQVFLKTMVILDKNKKKYFKQLRFELLNKPFNLESRDKAERYLLHFSMRFKPLLKDGLKNSSKPYLIYLCADTPPSQMKMLFTAVRLCQKMKDFEIITKTTIPLKILLKLSLNKDLKAKSNDQLLLWLEKVRASQGYQIPSLDGPIENSFIKIRFFHRLLYEIVHFFNEEVLAESKKGDVGILEQHLLQKNPQILEERDEKHLAWRKNLPIKHKLDMNGESYILEKIIDNLENDPAYPVVFAVEGNPAIEVVIETSEYKTYLQDFNYRSLHCGILQAKILIAEQYGAYSIRERLYHPLSLIEWQSANILDSRDKIAAAPIIELVQGLIRLPFTPYPLHPKNFLFNICEEMRSKVLLVPDMKNVDAIEFFIYQCAFGSQEKPNWTVFSYLIKASGLEGTKEAVFYHELIKMAAQGITQEKALSCFPSIKDAGKLKIIERLYIAIPRIKEKLKEELCKIYQVKDDKKFEKSLSQCIEDTHLTYCPGSILREDFHKKAKINLLSLIKPKIRESFYSPLKQKILKEMSSAKNRKDPIITKWKQDVNYKALGIYNLEQMQSILREGIKYLK